MRISRRSASGRMRTAATGKKSRKVERVEHRRRSRAASNALQGDAANGQRPSARHSARPRIERNVRSLTDLAPANEAGQALDKILPAECVQPARQKAGGYDAALLFLVFPIGVVGQAMADRDRGRRRRPPCKGRWESVATSAIPIGAPTTASCCRRKSEAAISVRRYGATRPLAEDRVRKRNGASSTRSCRRSMAIDICNSESLRTSRSRLRYFNRSLGTDH